MTANSGKRRVYERKQFPGIAQTFPFSFYDTAVQNLPCPTYISVLREHGLKLEARVMVIPKL